MCCHNDLVLAKSGCSLSRGSPIYATDLPQTRIPGNFGTELEVPIAKGAEQVFLFYKHQQVKIDGVCE